MSVLVDTSVLVGFLNVRDGHHDRATELMQALIEGLHGVPFVSDYVLDESYTFIRSRTGQPDLAARLWGLLQIEGQEGLLVVEFVGPEDFWLTVEFLAAHGDQPLSFTDGTTVTLVRRMGLDGVMSFDRDFDGHVERFH